MDDRSRGNEKIRLFMEDLWREWGTDELIYEYSIKIRDIAPNMPLAEYTNTVVISRSGTRERVFVFYFFWGNPDNGIQIFVACSKSILQYRTDSDLIYTSTMSKFDFQIIKDRISEIIIGRMTTELKYCREKLDTLEQYFKVICS